MADLVRTRFAPSPTGALHIGGVRTALFSWLFARHHHGRFILRIEDTDQERSTEASTQNILNGLQWLGIDYDEGPFFQHQRKTLYQQFAQKLIDANKAYYCYCDKRSLDALRQKQIERGEKPRYDRHCRDRSSAGTGTPCIRFKTPLTGKVRFKDAVLGEITTSNEELDDFVIMRPDGNPTYNFTVVVDDTDMGITHVIRGNDHVSNTPRQLHVIKALGGKIPLYAHVPMILNKDGKRLSKRDGAASIMDYAEQGYLPQAIRNYLVRLGWSHGDQEIFTLEEMIAHFNLEKIGKAAAAFNPEKLAWLNSHYLKQELEAMPAEQFVPILHDWLKQAHLPEPDADYITQVFNALKGRVERLDAMKEQVRFICETPDYSVAPSKAEKYLTPKSKVWLVHLAEQLFMNEEWSQQSIQSALEQTMQLESITLKQLGPVVRFALTGGVSSPDLITTVQLLRREPARQRITAAIQWIEARS